MIHILITTNICAINIYDLSTWDDYWFLVSNGRLFIKFLVHPSRRLWKTRWLPWPLISWDIFDFSSERNSTKLDRKQDLNVLYQVCVFGADQYHKSGYFLCWFIFANFGKKRIDLFLCFYIFANSFKCAICVYFVQLFLNINVSYAYKCPNILFKNTYAEKNVSFILKSTCANIHQLCINKE